MTVKIDSKITGFAVVAPEKLKQDLKSTGLHEEVERGNVLNGCTYKFKNPLKDFSIYVTINDKEIEGILYPYEMFLNCKDPESTQWVFALTQVLSGLFRKGGDCTYLIDALIEINDPEKGSHVKPGVGFVNSDVAEIGLILRKHFKHLAALNSTAHKEE